MPRHRTLLLSITIFTPPMLPQITFVLYSLSLVSHVVGLNILLCNDDSWASANIRATYKSLKDDGHDVLLVGPAVQQSGTGGTFTLPTTNIVAPGGEFGSIPIGAPFFGQDEMDANIWYFNGTPGATALFGIDVVAPKHFNKNDIDLVVSGPNESQNNGPFFYTISGTVGATYTSIERGYPAIALNAGNDTHRSFTTNTGEATDPANLAAKVTADFVKALELGHKHGERLLPIGVGLNINMPTFGPGNNCTDPPFELTRITRGAPVPKIVINASTGFPIPQAIIDPGVNAILNGDPNLPGEAVISAQCKTAVSIFSIDYDAPVFVAAPIQAHLKSALRKTGRQIL